MAHYATSTDFCLDPSSFLSVFAILIVLNIVKTREASEADYLQEQLELAHNHQQVLEEDIANLQSSVSLLINNSHKENLEAIITTLLQDKPCGMKCKYMLATILPCMPHLTKKDLNSVLYKMKSKNILQIKQSSDKAPKWILAE